MPKPAEQQLGGMSRANQYVGTTEASQRCLQGSLKAVSRNNLFLGQHVLGRQLLQLRCMHLLPTSRTWHCHSGVRFGCEFCKRAMLIINALVCRRMSSNEVAGVPRCLLT